MHAAPPTADEAARLTHLRALRILDTGAEPVWDRIVRLASSICDMPIALVSLVDEDRQWFKARVGLAAQETDRDFAFCAHAIHGPDIMEVPDTQADERFHDNPLVTGDPRIRFYAGIPIQGPEGHRLGTVCVIDQKPRRLEPGQRAALEDLGALAEHLLRVRAVGLELESFLDGDQRAFQHGQRVINHVSHELSTPLTPLCMDVGALRRHISDPDALRCLDRMERNLDRIKRVVRSAKDLLEVSEQAQRSDGTAPTNPRPRRVGRTTTAP